MDDKQLKAIFAATVQAEKTCYLIEIDASAMEHLQHTRVQLIAAKA